MIACPRMFPSGLALALALAACLGGASAQEPSPRDTIHFFTYDNDSRFMTDRFYTSGVQFSTKRIVDRRGQFARDFTATLCRWFECDASRLHSTQTNLGQLIYTPRDISRAAPQPLDRPWAGLLYYEQAHAFLSADRHTLTTLTGQIGATGRQSLAEPAQKLFHRVLDRPLPQGWDHQIGSSLAVMVSAEQRSALPALSFDLPRDVRFNTATYWRLATGNIQTYAAAGVALVMGKDLPEVSPPPPGIGNKVAPHPPRNMSSMTSCMLPFVQCTAFASVEGRLVAYNLFLDGRLFSDDPKVKRRTVVHEVVVGTRIDFPDTCSASHGPWFMQAKVTRRSPEFRSALPVPRHRVFALTIGTEF